MHGLLRVVLSMALIAAVMTVAVGGADAAEPAGGDLSSPTLAPLVLADDGDGIDGSYLITLDTAMPAAEAAELSGSLEAAVGRDGGQVTRRYR
ncbi:MAG: hypothetical protein AAF531_14435, partial [Actinomycetota bacterium]